jgi:Response regulator of the LytR/AlgR family
MLNFIIMDDEQKHNVNMKRRLDYIFEKHCIDAVTRLTASDPSQVLEYSMENVDSDNVYFLDVDLGCEINGIDLAAQIRNYDARSYFVFVSAHPEFVMPSLKTKIFDFLVKPISLEILEKCVLDIYKDSVSLKKEAGQILSIKSGINVHQLKIEEIIFLEKYGHILVVHTVNGQIRSKESLATIENRLDQNKFFKSHKSYLVNIDQISEIDNKNNLIHFKNGESCLMSKGHKKELKLACTI